MSWDYLQSPILRIRQRIAAELLLNCRRILEIGTFKNPITDYLLHDPDEIVVVDPLVEPYESNQRNGRRCRVRHLQMTLDEFDAAGWKQHAFGLLFCGMDLNRDNLEPDAWLNSVCKFIWLLSSASPCVIEYPVYWAPSVTLFEAILSLLQPKLSADIRMDLTRYVQSPEMTEETTSRFYRRMLALSDMETIDRPTDLLERAARIFFGSEAAPLVLAKTANTFVEVSGGLSVSRFKQSGDGSSKLVPDQGLLHVATSAAAWSFAVLFPLSQDVSSALNRCTAMPAVVRIQISVDHGEIVVGMLDESYRHITGERLVKASSERQEYNIFVPDLRNHLGLILRNGQFGPCVSKARVFEVTLQIAA